MFAVRRGLSPGGCAVADGREKEKEPCHVPVMAREVVAWLQPQRGRRYLDATCGGGALGAAILGASDSVHLLAIDWDADALARATRRLAPFAGRFCCVKGSFSQAKEILSTHGWDRVHGIVLDLGLSSLQLDDPTRGFSFLQDGPLDMRMDREKGLTAADLVNSASMRELARIIREYGEEKKATRIAAAICRARRKGRIVGTLDLARVVAGEVKRTGRLHPATRTFQALRIAVNDELGELQRFLENGYELLHPAGRMVVISYHSLEDRLVKNAFRKWAKRCLCPAGVPACCCGWSAKVRVLTPRPVRPEAEEVAANPRARSARLRAVEALQTGDREDA